MKCWACESEVKLEAHHLNPQRNNGSNHRDNILHLCVTCHDVVDCNQHLSREQLFRIDSYPKLQSLLIVRMMADVYNDRAACRVEQQVLETAIKVLQNPYDPRHLLKLQGAVQELRSRYKRSKE